MRAYLFEYIKYDTTKFLDKWKSEGSPYADIIGSDGSGFTSWLEQSDPSPAKKYVNWMIVRYLKGDIRRLEDIPSRIAPALMKFQSLQNKKKLKPEHSDINKIRSIEDVMDEYSIDSNQTQGNKSQAKSVEKSMYDSKEAELILNSPEYKIVVPKTEEASCFFGKNTRWCTAASNDNQFNRYSKKGPLYIILHKSTNTRWQFSFASDEYMDERDTPIKIIKFLLSHGPVYQVFKKLGYVDHISQDRWRIGNRYYNDQFQFHRLDGPAIERADGGKQWYQNGERHRLDGPAIEGADGGKHWYQNDKRHRLDGPAIEGADGGKHWYQNDKRHRLDGPAAEFANGSKQWYQNGKSHRLDGPAIEDADGTKAWYQNDKLHRLDGPAAEFANGRKYWYQNGKLHRLDGPAVEFANGDKSWYIDGQEYKQSQFKDKIKEMK